MRNRAVLPMDKDDIDAVVDMLQSHGWRVFKQRLLVRRADIQERLSCGRQMTIEEIRERQAQCAILALIADTPRALLED
jgi:hypothetical protein